MSRGQTAPLIPLSNLPNQRTAKMSIWIMSKCRYQLSIITIRCSDAESKSGAITVEVIRLFQKNLKYCNRNRY